MPMEATASRTRRGGEGEVAVGAGYQPWQVSFSRYANKQKGGASAVCLRKTM